MKTYLAGLLLVPAIWSAIPQLAVAKPQLANIKKESATAKISPASALERLILAPKLEASWFTPEFLKAVDKNSDVNTLQFQRDVTLKLGTMRYGNYKSVRSIGGDRYQIIFDRAEPDAVIAQFRLDVSGRIAEIRLAEKRNKPNAQAQSAAQAAVDRSFKTNVGSNGKPNQLFVSLKQWLGNYQKVRKQDETTYAGIFDRGSMPLEVNFKSDGSIENYLVRCPVTKIPLIQASIDLQKIFANCPNLK
jgi:hypothetical protein